MGIIPPFSPEDIRRILLEEEAVLRRAALPDSTVDAVVRYGAMVGVSLECFPTLDRGMVQARQLIDEYESAGQSFPSGLVIVADQLTGGRGRFQRSWHAPPGGVWLTLVLANTLLPQSSRLYPLAAGVACCETVQHFGLEGRLKWVNDVHLAGKKMAGVLVETLVSRRYQEEFILIGLGLNVNNQGFPVELSGLAVSMSEAAGQEFSRDQVVARLIVKLAWNIGLLHFEEARMLESGRDSWPVAAGGHALLHRWRQLSDTIGRKVRFGYDVQQRPQYEAEVLDIDETGCLVLNNLADGTRIVESAGEIVYLD